jgi:chorismate mutase/prephenate dehydratase
MYVFREVLSACLNLQKSLRVGFLGPQATFTHQAAIREFGSSVEFIAFRLNREVFRATAQGEVDFGVVPVENSTGGIVHDTLDSFIEQPDVRICSEILLPIHHALLGLCPISEVRRVYSHGQPFLQCARWLKNNLPDAQLIEVASTVQGMLEAKKESDAAAIGSEFAAEQYGLRVLAHRIEDSHDNRTRFLVLSRNDSRPSGDDKTSLMFGVKDEPGSLLRVLEPFSRLGINLSKIESRPTRKRAWEQAFFIDADGHHTGEALTAAIEQLSKVCETVRILGSYPRDRSPSSSDSEESTNSQTSISTRL